jgi:hypothetical protein
MDIAALPGRFHSRMLFATRIFGDHLYKSDSILLMSTVRGLGFPLSFALKVPRPSSELRANGASGSAMVQILSWAVDSHPYMFA